MTTSSRPCVRSANERGALFTNCGLLPTTVTIFTSAGYPGGSRSLGEAPLFGGCPDDSLDHAVTCTAAYYPFHERNSRRRHIPPRGRLRVSRRHSEAVA